VRVVVTGTRDASRDWVCPLFHGRTLDEILVTEIDALKVDALAHGAARGVDTIARNIAEDYPYCSISAYHAAWRGEDGKGPYRPQAGNERNAVMLDDFKPDLVLAFPRIGTRKVRKGTTDCIDKALERGIPIRVFPIEAPR
jgi:hypothetical protein